MSCAPGFSRVGNNCYRDCAPNFTTNGDICVPNCIVGVENGNDCLKIEYARTVISSASCPPNTTATLSQTGRKWPNNTTYTYCFPTCKDPAQQVYAPDDSGTCIPAICPIIDNVVPQTRFTQIGFDTSECDRSSYNLLRTFDFGTCPANKFITVKDANDQFQKYSDVNSAINGLLPGQTINTINPNMHGAYLQTAWKHFFECEKQCPPGYKRPYEIGVPDNVNYCINVLNNADRIFVDTETEIPSMCTGGRDLYGQPAVIPEYGHPDYPGYKGEAIPTPVKVTESLGIYDANILYANGDIVATFQDLNPNSDNYLRYMGPFFKIKDVTKRALGLPSYVASGFYYADPLYSNSNDFVTSLEIGTIIDYNKIRYAGESNFYRNLCTIDNVTGEDIYCAPTCTTNCPLGNSQNVGLFEPYYEVSDPPGLWNSTTSYLPNKVVFFAGNYYRATANQPNVNNQPPNATYWFTFQNWSSGISYNIGDTVQYLTFEGVKLYQCILQHTSTQLNNPLDGENYWSFYGQEIIAAKCYLRCGTSLLYEGDGPVCSAKLYTPKSYDVTPGFSYCANNSLPLPSVAGDVTTNQCYTLCPNGTSLEVPNKFPEDDNDPLWTSLFRKCLTTCPQNENFTDDGLACAKNSYVRIQQNQTFGEQITSAVTTSLRSNASTVSKIALYNGDRTLITVLVIIAIVSFFIVFVLWYQRMAMEKLK